MLNRTVRVVPLLLLKLLFQTLMRLQKTLILLLEQPMILWQVTTLTLKQLRSLLMAIPTKMAQLLALLV